jgi:hypothetical protein
MKDGDKCPECKVGILHDAVNRELYSKLNAEYYLICFACMTGFFKPIKTLDIIRLDFVVKGDHVDSGKYCTCLFPERVVSSPIDTVDSCKYCGKIIRGE